MLPCDCVPECTERLASCSCEPAAERLAEEFLSREDDLARTFTAASAEDGTFAVPVSTGRFVLLARKGRGFAALSEVASGTYGLELVLRTAKTCTARVRTSDKTRMAGVRVLVTQGKHVLRKVSDGLGKVEVDAVFDERCDFLAVHPGFLPAHGSTTSGFTTADLDLEEPARVQGRVSLDGSPVPGIEVRLLKGHLRSAAKTDGRGEFTFERLRSEEVHLVTATGGKCASAHVQAFPANVPADPVVLSLGDCHTLSGRVTTVQGEPLADATLTLSDGAGGLEVVAKSAADGSFRFEDALEALENLTVERKGYERRSGRIPGRVRAPLTIVLRPAAPLRGRVLSAADARPVPDALVVLEDPKNDDRWVGTTRTIPDGSFTLDEAPAGEFVLRVMHDDFFEVRRLTKLPGDHVEVALEPGSVIEGKVLGPDGSPCAGAHIAVAQGHRSSGETDLEGRFRLTSLAKGSQVLQVNPPRELAAIPARLEFDITGPRVELAVKLEAAATLSGVVVDAEDRPIAAAQVFAGPSDGTRRRSDDPGGQDGEETGATGRFELRHLRSGSYLVTAEAEGFEESKQQAKTGQTVTLRLERERTKMVVRGRVVSPEGEPVRIFTLDRCETRSADGRFQTERWPQSLYDLEVTAPGYASLTRPLEHKAGEVLDLGDLVLSRGSTLAGVVLEDGSLTPLADAFVEAGTAEALADWFESVEHPNSYVAERLAEHPRTGKDGTFRLEHRGPEATHLFVYEAGHRPRVLAVPPDRENIQVFLERGGEIQGTVKDDPGELKRARGWVRSTHPKLVMHIDYRTPEEPHLANLDSSGAFVISGLAPGRYEVTAVQPGNPSAVYTKVEVDVPMRGRATVDVARRHGFDVILHVIEADGSPAEYSYGQLVAGEVGLPATSSEREALNRQSQWAVTLLAGRGFPAVAPGRYTLLVPTREKEGGTHVLREVVDITKDRQVLEVRLRRGLPVFVDSPKSEP
ncbi:MAG: carboxypeptidase-like regulatory domain-containing protein [Myxococcales bacterium]